METKQSSGVKLAVFDYDGTITHQGKVAITDSAIYGLDTLRSSGIITTTITARPFQRLRSISGGIENIVSPGAPLATDRGARIIDGTKSGNLQYTPLTYREHNAIADITMTNVDFIGFYPEELYGTSYVWTPERNRRDEMASLYGHDAVILAGSTSELRAALKIANPCLVTVCFKNEQASNISLLSDKLNTEWSSRAVSIIPGGIDKASALKAICLGVGTQLSDVLYAGNDINDTPILRMPELAKRILVGDRLIPDIADPFTHIASPDLLGDYLQSITEDYRELHPSI